MFLNVRPILRCLILAALAECCAEASETHPHREQADGQCCSAKEHLRPEDAFAVRLPSGSKWEVFHRGQAGIEDSFMIIVADTTRRLQLTVLVMPNLTDAPTLKSMKTGWEKGFLKKASRKKSSEDIVISGEPAYKVTAALATDDGEIFEAIGILLVGETFNFVVGVTGPKEDVFDDPEVREFIKSFKIKE